MLTIRDDLERDVELHCQCIDDNEIINGTRWFLPNMSIVPADISNRPYSTGAAPSRLIFISPFNGSDTGIYTCSPDSTFPTTPPGDSITLNTAGKYCLVDHTSLSNRCSISALSKLQCVDSVIQYSIDIVILNTTVCHLPVAVQVLNLCA